MGGGGQAGDASDGREPRVK
uniref:Uncharacterized protein n=1 Tax=Arundo donax TaxID=35708 RepID=A0A0A9HP36_ARUDO